MMRAYQFSSVNIAPVARVASAVAAALCIGVAPAAAQRPAVAAAFVDTTSISADVGHTTFSGTTDPWTQGSVSMGRRTRAGSIIARVNYARRFNTDGVQMEFDAYPRFGDGRYLYVNAGYSGASVFPKWRYGVEAYTTLPKAWEASVGVRSLHFGGTPVTLLTGSVGHYTGNYWLSFRPFVHSSDGELSASGSLVVRRYRADAEHWTGGSIGYGNSPSDRITPDAVARLHAFSASLNGTVGLAPKLLLTWSVGHDAEELTANNTRRSTTLSAGFKHIF